MSRTVKQEAPEILYDGSTGHPTVIAFDPGGVTGWAVGKVHPYCLTEPDQYMVLDNIDTLQIGQFVGNERQQVDQMLELCAAWPGAAVVVEDFILRAFRQDRNLLSPVRITAAFRYALGPNVVCTMQQPSLAMNTMKDEQLKAIGYYERTVGQQHARDALRHLFTYLIRLRNDPARLAAAFPALFRP